MSNVIFDELHAATAYLEAEGHTLAGRFRDLVNQLKGDAENVQKDGGDLVSQLTDSLTKALAPVLDRVKADVVADGKAGYAAALDAAAPVLAAGTTEAHKALADALAAVRSALPTPAAPAAQ